MTVSVVREALRPLAGLTAGALALVLSGCGATWTPLDGDGDGISIAEGDCDESAATGASIGPNAAEVAYDGVDQNCNGDADENDKDGDGVASTEFGGTDCWDDPDLVPDAFVALNGLPQLGAADVFPGAPTDTFYDGIDQDCAGDGDFDKDGDGFASGAWPQRDGSVGSDCWDADEEDAPVVATCGGDGSGSLLTAADVNPEATDASLLDGIDQDCSADDSRLEFDLDGDTFAFCEECDDANAAIYPDPAIPEVWYNGVDENCDLNDGDQDGDGYVDAAYTGPLDPDGDGTDNFAAGDCWDTPEVRPDAFTPLNDLPALEAAVVNPGAQGDAPYDGVDQDCAGGDEFDVDGDGVHTSAFVDRAGTAGTDCDDADAGVLPGAEDPFYDGVDSDCGGEDDYDADGDGHVAPDYAGLTTLYAAGTGALPADDCDDDNVDANGGIADEDCDTAFDDDCDGATDAVDAIACTVFHDDADRDGFGNAAATQCSCEPLGTFDVAPALATDCDDSVSTGPGRAPGRAEVPGDGIDQDCDALGVDACYEDLDEDGFGSDTVVAGLSLDCAADGQRAKVAGDCLDIGYGAVRTHPGAAVQEPATACTRDMDQDGYGDESPVAGITPGRDCDDGEAVVFPGAVAEATASQCMRDDDGDGYGDASPPSGYDAGHDCNDAAATIKPGAVTEATATQCMLDVDGDGYGDASPPSGYDAGRDCNDVTAEIKPGATDLPVDGIDQDCDNREVCYVDEDGDGVGVPSTAVSLTGSCTTAGYSTRNDDCHDDPADPRAASTFPGAGRFESSASGCRLDADGDGFGEAVIPDDLLAVAGLVAGTDCLDDAADADAAVTFPGAGALEGDAAVAAACVTDRDGDQYADEAPSAAGVVAGTDCLDTDPDFHPDAEEVAVDGLDQNCNGTDACYADLDEDAFGTLTLDDTVTLDCASGARVATVSTDCDDEDAGIFPGASGDVVGDEVDQDCDGREICVLDADGDGYGDDGRNAFAQPTVESPDTTCRAAGESTAARATDCDDARGDVTPGRPENGVADGLDDNCDDREACYADADHDGRGTAAGVDNLVLDADLACGSVGSAGTDDDCDDSRGDITPGRAEAVVADGVDDNCDGSEQCYSDADGDGFRDTALVAYAVTAGSTGNCSVALAGGGVRAQASAGTDCDDDPTAHGPDAWHSVSIAVNGAAGIRPSATDTPADGINQDCSAGDTCYVDADGDTFGSTDTTSSIDLDCLDLSEADDASDCLDTGLDAASAHPGAAPNDSRTACMMDADGDGWGSTARPGTGALGTDCDDADPGDYPSATEIVGNLDDEDCSNTEICYVNADGDSHRVGPSGAQRMTAVSAALWVSSADMDCSDAGEAAASVPNDDCLDTGTDAAFAFPGAAPNETGGATACMMDVDGDDYGRSTAPGTGAAGSDCDDASSSVHPSASDTAADGIDSNCDSSEPCYSDADGDGYRDTVLVAYTVTAGSTGNCSVALAGGGSRALATASTDCLDTGVHASATYPRTNGVAGWLDASGCMTDADDDKYGATSVTGGVTAGLDCDDAAGTTRPGVTDIVNNGINEDCSAGDACYADADGDGFGSSSATVSSLDLDCADAGEADDATDCLDSGTNAVSAFPGAAPNDSPTACMMDVDGDDWGSTTQPSATGGVGTDCLDAGTGPGGQLAIAVKPGATEICDADNFDEDCDGTADDADTSVSAAGKVTYYRDDDGDGFANLASAGTPTCDPAPPYIALASSCTAAQLVISPNCDCNDVLNNNGALMDPGNTEVCDGGNVDEDCDGAWDDNDTGGASGKSTYYADSDGDGFGNSSSSVSRCDMPSGYVTNASDCATINAAGTTVAAVDTSARTYPGAQEYCDGVRTDCRASNSTDGQFEFGLISYTTSANAAWNSATFTNVTDRDVTPTYRLAESFTDSNVNGVYDAGETYVDTDGNGVYTGPRTFTLTSSTTYNICPWPSASSWTNASGSTVNGTPPGTANNYYARFVVGATSGTGSTGGITATLRGCPTDAGASCSTAASTNTAITLNGAGIAATSGAPHGGLLKVYPSVTANTPNAVTMSNLTLTGGRGFYATNTRGGAIHLDRNASDTGTEQTLALTNVVITGNSVLNGGGGVALVNSARMTMNGVTVSSNSGAGGGGLLLFNTARVEATGGSITGNSATSSAAGNGGGGIYVQNAAQLSLTNVAVSSNTAPLGGGVLVTNTARVDMSGGSINGNRSSTNGGGGVSMAVNARMRVVNTSITGNCAGSLSGTTCTANNVGGGVLISGSAGNTPTFHCVGSTAATTYGVYANTSTYGGGIAVSANYGNVCLNTCDFGHGGGSSTNNTASSSTNTRSMSYLYSSAWRATSGGGSTWPEGTMGDDQPNGSSKNYAFAGLATPTITTPAACTLP